MEDKNKYKRVPSVALRSLVVLPGTVVHFDVSRQKSIRAIEKAMGEDEKIFLVTQTDASTAEPELQDLYRYGTYCRIKQIVRSNNKNSLRIMV